MNAERTVDFEALWESKFSPTQNSKVLSFTFINCYYYCCLFWKRKRKRKKKGLFFLFQRNRAVALTRLIPSRSSDFSLSISRNKYKYATLIHSFKPTNYKKKIFFSLYLLLLLFYLFLVSLSLSSFSSRARSLSLLMLRRRPPPPPPLHQCRPPLRRRWIRWRVGLSPTTRSRWIRWSNRWGSPMSSSPFAPPSSSEASKVSPLSLYLKTQLNKYLLLLLCFIF